MTRSGADLTPFGFTGTESAVYGALLRSGPSTGYAVAQAVSMARANVYSALSGLVARGAATLLAGRPARYRPVDPQTLITQLAADQAAALERLEESLRGAAVEPSKTVHEVSGGRPLANVVLQLVARAVQSVQGVVAGDLFRATGPAWRRAAARASLSVRSAGTVDDSDGILAGVAPPDADTILVVDGSIVILATGAADAARGLWSDHPLLVLVAQRALARQT